MERTQRCCLCVEYYFDPESNNWSCVVPLLGIVGGSDTRSDAECEVVEAIEFSLECDDDPAPENGDVEYLRVTVER